VIWRQRGDDALQALHGQPALDCMKARSAFNLH
jgi:hypothetical protein